MEKTQHRGFGSDFCQHFPSMVLLGKHELASVWVTSATAENATILSKLLLGSGDVNCLTCSGVFLVSAYFRFEKHSKVTPIVFGNFDDVTVCGKSVGSTSGFGFWGAHFFRRLRSAQPAALALGGS